ncbi:EF hand domain containing protein [Acanthamoeba castellanii str. Neff]|uniref:Mitochondrial proton/calcium exchanger protein n=1 Tax=Acanthamoeba castellanii (strain ATCC 30010 / Neff) TaxID=1257118 RepID=L8GE43_ACACF|nr:EF hand domain containing protein [Acanthamoeba castellanii str. Neff]ELR11302.1 EF hand domain containing protein [Acanthamoeba castellanii str. Neff]
MDTLRHFWAGSRLLAANVKAASMLLRKKIAGQNLTRRERRLLTQTTVDLFRLVPFLAIVVIPFAELLLPVLLAVFPNMLPSTFEDKIKKLNLTLTRYTQRQEEARRKAVQLKLEMAKFLEDALYLRSLQISHDTPSAATFAEAMKKVKEGQSLETKEILGLSKLFEDKFTLEMLDRQQVVAMCKYMGLSRFGTTHYLRNQLRSKLHDIREDDDLIAQEAALDKFTEAEMKQATQVRGMDYKDFNTARSIRHIGRELMRLCFLAKAQMEQWLLLSAQHVPPSLLILSRAFALTSAYSSLKPLEGQQVVTKKAETGEIALPKAMEEALHKTISALPDQLVADTKLTSATKTTQDMVSKLEVLQEQIQAIKTEEKEKKEKEREEKAKAPATEAEAKQATKKDAAGAYSAEQMKVVSEAVSLLFASAPSKIKREREALEQLKERKEERKEEREEELSAASASTDQPQHQPQPPPQDKVVHTLETKLEKMIAKLDKEMDKIDQRAHTLMSIIDTNQDGQISFEEFQEAVSHLKAKYSPEDITTMWRKLDTNNDGQVSLEQLEQLYSAGADEHHER